MSWSPLGEIGTVWPPSGPTTVLRAEDHETSGRLVARLAALQASAPVTIIANEIHANVPARLSQLNWLDGGSGRHACSKVGRVELNVPASVEQFLNGTGCYVNITTRVPGGDPLWSVRSLYLACPDPRYMLRSQPGVQFGLPTSPGQCFDAIQYGLSVTPFPLFTWFVQPTRHAPIFQMDYLVGGLIADDGEGGGSGDSDRPDNATPYEGAAPTAKAVRTERIAVPGKDLPRISEHDGGCGPGAAARSIVYLLGRSGTRLASPQKIYEDLERRMGVTFDGTNILDLLAGKQRYTEAHGLPIVSFLELMPPCHDSVMKALADGCDVEALIAFRPKGGHVAMVTSMTKFDNGQCEVTTVQDATQGDGKATNAEELITASATTGDYADGKLFGFLIECPRSE